MLYCFKYLRSHQPFVWAELELKLLTHCMEMDIFCVLCKVGCVWCWTEHLYHFIFSWFFFSKIELLFPVVHQLVQLLMPCSCQARQAEEAECKHCQGERGTGSHPTLTCCYIGAVLPSQAGGGLCQTVPCGLQSHQESFLQNCDTETW